MKIAKSLEFLMKDYHLYFNPSKLHDTTITKKEKPIKISKEIGCRNLMKRKIPSLLKR
ncbi:MAG: hypothetical protein LM587_01100 [Candidatus Aenigmarchaeota archaeon]|jgi:hypothetical protein|nr:hypothetical protein [Candidatus Aenigmarchaeota archaeon]